MLDLALELKPEYELKPGQSIIDGVVCEALEGKWYAVENTEKFAAGEEVALVVEEGFRVKDEASANWVLSKYLDADARIAAVLGDPEVIKAKAILANAAALEKKARNSLAWLEARFKPELAEFAKTQLQGKKTKTWSTILGGVSFRTVPGGLKVADEQKAVKFAEEFVPAALKVQKSFLISEISSEMKTAVREFFEAYSNYQNLVRGAEYLGLTVQPDCKERNSIESVKLLVLLQKIETLLDQEIPCTDLNPLTDLGIDEKWEWLRGIFSLEPDKESVTIKTGVGK